MNMKKILQEHAYILFIMIVLTSCNELDDISNKIKSGIQKIQYSLHTADTHQTMDCLKICYEHENGIFGIFHTVNQATHFSQLYYAELDSETFQWKNTVKLSDRGSQGTVVRVYNQGKPVGFLVGYQLQNPNGNKVAIRYYQSQYKIKVNNFLYEYQLIPIVSNKQVKNVGTVSLQQIKLLRQQNQEKYNQYLLNIKFHYSPDGSHDFPGYGFVYLRPLRDFVDNTGKWIGGCYLNYKDWTGYADTTTQGALRQAGCLGKIGQRDYFYLGNNKYYMYQCNINSAFDWYSWRIILYSPTLKLAKAIGLALGGDIDLANPHISLISKSNNSYQFAMTFFLPGEGISPDRQARGGQSVVITKFSYP